MQRPELILDVIDHFPSVIAKHYLGDGGTYGLTQAVRALNAAGRFRHRVLVESDVPVAPSLMEALIAGGSVTRVAVSQQQLKALMAEAGLPEWTVRDRPVATGQPGLPAWLAAATGEDTLLVWDDLRPLEARALLPILNQAKIPSLIVTTTLRGITVPYAVFPVSRAARQSGAPSPAPHLVFPRGQDAQPLFDSATVWLMQGDVRSQSDLATLVAG